MDASFAVGKWVEQLPSHRFQMLTLALGGQGHVAFDDGLEDGVVFGKAVLVMRMQCYISPISADVAFSAASRANSGSMSRRASITSAGLVLLVI